MAVLRPTRAGHRLWLAGLLLALALPGCAGWRDALPGWPDALRFGGEEELDVAAPDLRAGVERVDAEAVHDFHTQATRFYGRLARRRFNTRATWRDEGLREFFRSESAFADYYAELAQALRVAAFERERPLSLEVLEFAFEAPGEARVRVRLLGEDGRPLRWGETELTRDDRWHRIDGRWWIVPGKL